ncbi:MAG: hypothetical protein JXA33_24420 [Anaerolineae bacterium]|nr:hypothetical protein [Anaerolineae bacterium]
MEYLDYPAIEPDVPDSLVEVQVQVEDGQSDLSNITVRALRDEEEIGICNVLSASDMSPAHEAQDRIFVDGRYRR